MGTGVQSGFVFSRREQYQSFDILWKLRRKLEILNGREMGQLKAVLSTKESHKGFEVDIDDHIRQGRPPKGNRCNATLGQSNGFRPLILKHIGEGCYRVAQPAYPRSHSAALIMDTPFANLLHRFLSTVS